MSADDPMDGIGKRYAGLCDQVPQLPKPGTPEREASDAAHRAMCEGLMRQYEGRPRA